MSESRCDACCFWDRLDDHDQDDGFTEDDTQGHCRRMPPQFMASVLGLVVRSHEEEQDTKGFDLENAAFIEAQRSSYWGFPVTDGMDWCGEWRGKDEVSQKPVLPDFIQFRGSLPLRIRRALKRGEWPEQEPIDTWDRLFGMVDPLSIKDFGKVSLQQLIEAIESVGLKAPSGWK